MQYHTYTHSPIIGKPATAMLPKGTALILEGGGLRGYYSAGAMDALLKANLQFPYIAGVSAGAANGLSYVSGQLGRGREIVQYYVADKRYVSRRNMLLHGSMFNMNFVFQKIPQNHLFFDWDAFRGNDIRYLTGAADCETGTTHWFEKADLDSEMTAVIASCSIPMMSRMVHFKGMALLDGGITDPIPVEKSIADGNTFHFIILTRNEGYQKSPMGHEKALRFVFRKYPKLADALLCRHETYNRQLALCEALEKQGKALILRPKKPLQIDRMDNNTKKLLALYDEGEAECLALLPRLKEILHI